MQVWARKACPPWGKALRFFLINRAGQIMRIMRDQKVERIGRLGEERRFRGRFSLNGPGWKSCSKTEARISTFLTHYFQRG